MTSIVEEGSDAIELATEVHERLHQSNICGICPNLMTSDDAVWYAAGGKRLVHRYCRASAARV
jgi:hypothetical protein